MMEHFKIVVETTIEEESLGKDETVENFIGDVVRTPYHVMTVKKCS